MILERPEKVVQPALIVWWVIGAVSDWAQAGCRTRLVLFVDTASWVAQSTCAIRVQAKIIGMTVKLRVSLASNSLNLENFTDLKISPGIEIFIVLTEDE